MGLSSRSAGRPGGSRAIHAGGNPGARAPVPAPLLALAGEHAWAAGTVIVAAHPDDETIGAGGILPYVRPKAVVHVTDGAPHDRRWWGDPSLPSREAYAEVRAAELACALAVAGVGSERMHTLGRADQRASADLAALARDLATLLGRLRPGVVITHPYEGGHPDHDATAFAVHAARALMAGAPPVIVELTSYHALGDGLEAGSFFPADGCEPVRVALTAGDRDRKRRMLGCFGTQQATLAQFPVAGAERFRAAPGYDFTRPPHAGTLHYERFGWGCTGEEWRARAAAALGALAIAEGAPC